MGFFKDVLNNVKSDMTWKARQEVSTGVNKGISKIMSRDKNNSDKCPKCRKNIDASMKFCQSCGYKLRISCKKCNLDFPIGIKFCSECGGQLK